MHISNTLAGRNEQMNRLFEKTLLVLTSVASYIENNYNQCNIFDHELYGRVTVSKLDDNRTRLSLYYSSIT